VAQEPVGRTSFAISPSGLFDLELDCLALFETR